MEKNNCKELIGKHKNIECSREAKKEGFSTFHYNRKENKDKKEENVTKKEKKCNGCLQIKEINKFISLANGRETRKCIDCRLKCKNGSKKKEFLDELRKKLPPCEICGDDNPFHKEFDHIEPGDKKDNVTNLYVKFMEEEASKCRSLCIKCHRKITIKNNESSKKNVRKNVKFIKEYKMKIGKCQNPECEDIFDIENLGFYEFDHIDFRNKDGQISDMVTRGISLNLIKIELEKCIMLCAYCHKEKTIEQNKEKKKYYLSLDKPIKNDYKWKDPGNFTDEQIKNIRELYNNSYKTIDAIAKIYKTTIKTIYHIIDNVVYIDPNYKRIREKKKKFPPLEENKKEEIFDLWNQKPRPYTAKEIMKMFNCGKGTFEKIVYG